MEKEGPWKRKDRDTERAAARLKKYERSSGGGAKLRNNNSSCIRIPNGLTGSSHDRPNRYELVAMAPVVHDRSSIWAHRCILQYKVKDHGAKVRK